MRLVRSEGQLYIVEFGSGVIKVGKAWQARRRIASHAQGAQIHGGSIARSWASDQHPDYHDTERQLIAFCKKAGEQAVGREYFRGITFEIACDRAEAIVWSARRPEPVVSTQTAAPQDPLARLYDIATVARLLSLRESAINRIVTRREIDVVRGGTGVLISAGALSDFIERKKQESAA